MGLFDRFRSKPRDDFGMRAELVELVKRRLTGRGNRIRAEDALCAASAIVGERCIDAAGDFPLREHTMVPGQRVFSDRINQLLCGDLPDVDIDSAPPEPVFGRLRAKVDISYYRVEHFPSLTSVFGGFAAGVGNAADWGKVPVTVLPRNHPTILPLQFGYETREKVDAILSAAADDKMRCLMIATDALSVLLNQMVRAIEPDVALRLAFEITNGMAKTAPMTKSAMTAMKRSDPRG